MSYPPSSDWPHKAPSDELLTRYVADECSLDERDLIRTWAAGSPQNTAALDVVNKVWSASRNEHVPVETSDFLARLNTKIDSDQTSSFTVAESFSAGDSFSTGESSGELFLAAESFPSLSDTKRKSSHGVRSPMYSVNRNNVDSRGFDSWMKNSWRTMLMGGGIAALVVWAFITGIVLPENQAEMAQTTPGERTYTTGKGQRTTVLLADGSRVHLSVASTLKYREEETGARTVDLDGEALFEIVHNPQKPFVVTTGTTTTRVLGTEFFVRKYREDSSTRVAVATGRVALQDVVLGAGEIGRTSGMDVVVTRGFSLDSLSAWSQGRIVFKGRPFGEVLAELSRWYDVDFRCTDPRLIAEPITQQFTNASAEDVASTLAALLEVQYRYSDGTIVFTK